MSKQSPILLELATLRDKEDNEELSEKEQNRLYSLESEWNELRYSSIPKLDCCEAIRNFPVIYFEAESADNEYSTKGHWRAALPEHVRNSLALVQHDYWRRPQEEAKFCPYCSTPVPKMRLKTPPPLSVYRGDGYYCSTCKERCNTCQCLPPEALFEHA